MEIENFKKLNFNNLLICLLFSLVVFYLFKNFHFFNNFLGQINLVEEGINPKPETCYDFFCRAAIIPYLYYLLLNFLKLDVLIFFQIFLLIFFSFLIRINLINLKLNPLVANILFFIIVFNPKILKYSFGTQEESFFIPALLFGISTIFNFFLRKNIKNLIYLNLAFALIVLIRESGIIFYFLLVIINIYYLVKIDLSVLKKKFVLAIFLVFVLFSPKMINSMLTNYLNPEKINNHYFSMHALTSLISKQNNNLSYAADDLSRLINNRISKLNNLRQIEKLDKFKKLNFECIIFPAMNNLSYLHPEILSFYENNYTENLNKKLFFLYIDNFFKDPRNFLTKFHQCFIGNFLMVEILTKKEINEINKILNNKSFDKDDKRIIERFHKISKNYYGLVIPLRILGFCIFLITLLSIIISIYSLLKNKKDIFALLSLLFFLMYYLVIHLHVNLISVQVRWFFTYYPILIFSNLKIIEIINTFISRKLKI